MCSPPLHPVSWAPTVPTAEPSLACRDEAAAPAPGGLGGGVPAQDVPLAEGHPGLPERHHHFICRQPRPSLSLSWGKEVCGVSGRREREGLALPTSLFLKVNPSLVKKMVLLEPRGGLGIWSPGKPRSFTGLRGPGGQGAASWSECLCPALSSSFSEVQGSCYVRDDR